ncbi:putative inhibitor of apoptosis [Dirofilaria immitis]
MVEYARVFGGALRPVDTAAYVSLKLHLEEVKDIKKSKAESIGKLEEKEQMKRTSQGHERSVCEGHDSEITLPSVVLQWDHILLRYKQTIIDFATQINYHPSVGDE